MNILMIHHRLPFPLHSGMDKVRFNLLRSLSNRHNVTLIAPIFYDTSAEDIQQVENICFRLRTVHVGQGYLSKRRGLVFSLWMYWRLIVLRQPMYTTTEYYPEVSREIKKELKVHSYDLVQTTSNIAARYLSDIRDHHLVMGPMDDYIKAARSNRAVCTSIKDWFVWRMRERARKYFEPKMSKKCIRVYFHSEDDIESFSSVAGEMKNARVLLTPVEFENDQEFDFTQVKAQENTSSVVFVGGLGSSFNIDAVVYFYKHIFPLIKSEIPNTHFFVVGHSPPFQIKEIAKDPSVTVTGFVPDVGEYLRKAAVVVAPVRAGTGFKTKVVEALSAGKPVVALPAGVQGLWNLEGDAVRVVSSAQTFASEVIFLLRNDEHRHKMGRYARELYEKSYSFDVVTPMVLKEYEELEEALGKEP